MFLVSGVILSPPTVAALDMFLVSGVNLSPSTGHALTRHMVLVSGVFLSLPIVATQYMFQPVVQYEVRNVATCTYTLFFSQWCNI